MARLGMRRTRRSRFALLTVAGAFIVVGLLAMMAGPALAFSDGGTVDVQVPDKTKSDRDAMTSAGAFISYFGDSDTGFGSSGTGVFNPFVRLQHDGTEQGYNTDGALQFDTKAGKWTHSILVSQIPQRPCPEGGIEDSVPTPPPPPPALLSETCFELFVDINESNTDKQVALTDVEVWFAPAPGGKTITGYPFSAPATLQYDFSGSIQINDVNQGSGRGDLRYDIPVGTGPNQIPIPPGCFYGAPLGTCNTYFVLYSKWGGAGAFDSEGGFEEWKVRVYPAISLTKTPSVTDVCNGSNTQVTYTYVVTNNSPGGGSVDGSVVDDNGTPGNTADDVTVGTFTKLAAGASQTYTHVFTVNGTRTNVATATATDANGQKATATATATVTGHDCTITITKKTTTPDICKGSTASYEIVVTNNSDKFSWTGSVVDDKLGTLDASLTLGPGASKTYTPTSGPLTAETTNTVKADGKFDDPASTSASATASATVKVHDCTITITKKTTTPDICKGSTASYEIVVTNNSDKFSWTGSVVDDKLGTLDASLTLGPGASKTYTPTSGPLTAETTNTVKADGKFDDPASTSASATASATVKVHDCTISLTKTPNKTEVCNGSSVTYTYVVTNNSDFFTWTGTLTDDKLGAINGTITLGPGESKTFTAGANITGDVTNTATASGAFNDPASTSASASASATVHGRNCAQITPTSTTCNDFKSGTASTLPEIQYSVQGGTISQVNPGVFFYWVQVSGPGPFTITQSVSPAMPFFTQASGAFAFDANCTNISSAKATYDPATGSVTVTGSGIAFIGIKYDTHSVVGSAPPAGGTATYTFALQGVPGSEASIKLVPKP
jgi:hypothetical protein